MVGFFMFVQPYYILVILKNIYSLVAEEAPQAV